MPSWGSGSWHVGSSWGRPAEWAPGEVTVVVSSPEICRAAWQPRQGFYALFLLGENLGLASQGHQIEGVRPSHAVESKQLRPNSTDLNVSHRSEKYLHRNT